MNVHRVGLALALCAGALGAQTPADATVRRAVTAVQTNNGNLALSTLSGVNLNRLSVRDRAIAEMYRGFGLILARRANEADVYLQRSAAIDATVRPEGTLPAELLDAYRIARARVPVIARFNFAPAEFAPQLDSVTRLSYQFEGNRILRRNRASLRFAIVSKSTMDTVTVWRGNEGDTFAWDGKLRGTLIQPGEYDYVMQASTVDVDVPATTIRRVTITHGQVASIASIALPTPPRALPETTSYMVEDVEKKSAKMRRAITVGAIGALLAGGSAALVQTTVNNTAPSSAPRYIVAGTYSVGLATLLSGAYLALRAKTTNYKSQVTFPNTENVRLNRELRAEYQRETERVNRYNETLRNAILVRQVFAEGQ